MEKDTFICILSFLAFSRIDDLGYKLPAVGPNIMLTEFLGHGGSSNVYKGVCQVAVKVYRSSQSSRKYHEEEILKLLCGVEDIPTW